MSNSTRSALGFEYIEFVVQAHAKGAPRIVDWAPLSSGELYSDVIGRMARILTEPAPGLIRSLLGMQQIDQATPKRTKTIAEMRRRGDLRGAFMLLDHYFFAKDLAKCLQAITAIESRAGVDGMTQMLRSNIYASSGMHKEAVTYARTAIEIEPTMSDPYFTLSHSLVVLEQFDAASGVYKTLQDDFGKLRGGRDVQEVRRVPAVPEVAAGLGDVPKPTVQFAGRGAIGILMTDRPRVAMSRAPLPVVTCARGSGCGSFGAAESRIEVELPAGGARRYPGAA